MIYADVNELKDALRNIVEIADDLTPKVLDKDRFRSDVIDKLINTAVFAEDAAFCETCQTLIRSTAKDLGAVTASIQGLYEAMGREEVAGFTVPAINIRGMTYDVARAVFRTAMRLDVGPFLFEIARSEIGYTGQSPSEYSASICAAALKEDYTGPVMVQGDHFQVKAGVYKEDPDKEIEALKSLILEAIDARFYNIDIDASTLVDLSYDTLDEQQRLNYEVCAELTRFIRENEPHNVTISVGGEIGEVGKKNSTPEELKAFMDGYNRTLTGGYKGISKMSVQSGTSHGGVVLPDGSIAEVALDFDTLKSLSRVARKEYGLSGAVQHGASTLPEEVFDKFPESECSEIHLATGFQNQIYDHVSFPEALRSEIYHYLSNTHVSEMKDDWTKEQFFYKTRKKGFGPFKKQLWSLESSVKDAIMKSLEDTFELLFGKLKVTGTRADTIGFIDLPE